MAFTPEQHREYRARLRSEGTCTRCRKRPAKQHCSACSECIDVHTRRAARMREKWSRDPLACKQCGRPLPEPGPHRCRICADYLMHRQRMYRALGGPHG